MADTGDELLKAWDAPQQSLDPLAEDFLYRDTNTCIYAAPGKGKSTVILNLLANLALGQPVFDQCPVPRPMRCFYLQLEGSPSETNQRFALLRESYGLGVGDRWACDNLICEFFEGINLLKQDTLDMLMDLISGYIEADKPIDLIVVDPLYMAVVGAGMNKDETAQQAAQVWAKLRQAFNCAILFTHHSHRAKYGVDRKKIIEEDGDYYGSVYFQAALSGDWRLEQESKHQITLTNKKDRNSNLAAKFVLDYDAEYFRLRAAVETGKELSALEKVKAVHNLLLKRGQNVTTFNEVLALSNVSAGRIRQLQLDSGFPQMFEVQKVKGRSSLWKVIT